MGAQTASVGRNWRSSEIDPHGSRCPYWEGSHCKRRCGRKSCDRVLGPVSPQTICPPRPCGAPAGTWFPIGPRRRQHRVDEPLDGEREQLVEFGVLEEAADDRRAWRSSCARSAAGGSSTTIVLTVVAVATALLMQASVLAF